MSRAMKDSGVAWIGEIPEGWKTVRFKFLHNGMNTGEGIDKEYWSTDDQDAIFYTAGLEPIRTNYGDFPKWKYTKASDLLLARNGTPYVYLPVEGACYTDHIIRASLKENTIREFIRYSLQQSIASVVVDSVSLATWSASLWDEQAIAWPPLPEQSRIAAFLDRRCAEIDRVIAATQRTIEEYKKLKQSIITEAVTHGVRGGRKMKDSGVSGMGEVPAEWRMMRLKYLMTVIVDCPHETPNYSSDGDYLVIRTADQDYATLRSDENMYRLNKEEYENRIRRLPLDADDIVYGREGERWGLASRVPESGKYCLGQRIMQFRCNQVLILPCFAVYALSSLHVRRQGEYDTFGSTSPHVNISTIQNYAIPTPSIDEQETIVFYLDHRCAEIERLISAKQQLLAQLEAYKESVIYEYVTGKREVPA